jgi:hypothetical protein
MDKLCW